MFGFCWCLQPVLRKGFLGRCLSLNQRPGCAVVNSFEARLGTVDEKVMHRLPFKLTMDGIYYEFRTGDGCISHAW
jgi:hypothetical protein